MFGGSLLATCEVIYGIYAVIAQGLAQISQLPNGLSHLTSRGMQGLCVDVNGHAFTLGTTCYFFVFSPSRWRLCLVSFPSASCFRLLSLECVDEYL